MVTLKFAELSNFNFTQAIQKLSSAPTHGKAASEIHKITKLVQNAKDYISKKYQADLVTKFGKKDEAGVVIRPEDNPNGFDIIETMEKEFEAAQEEFGKTEVELDCQPFTLSVIGDIKVSANDLESLKALYQGNHEFSKPAIPTLSAVN